MIRITLAAVLLVHAVAHLVGFAVPWRLVVSPELPYKTTIFGGRLDIGAGGIRMMGVLWLLLSVSFLAAGAGLVFRAAWALPFAVAVTIASAALCVTEWPYARIGLLFNVALLAASPALGSYLWHDASSVEARTLESRAATTARAFSVDCLENLPAPVARYFRRALRDGQPYVNSVHLVQDAEFRVGQAWRPLRATQHFTTDPPGFVWDASIQMAPYLPVFVRDSYIDGRGAMRGRFLGLYPVVDQAHAPELNAGALHRYFAEALWFPTALLPGEHVIWQAIDDHRALATMTDHQTTVSLQFHFNDSGDVVEVVAPDRFREVNGRYEPTPWAVTCSEYDERHGLRIPLRCQVEWRLPEGPLPYWRGRIVDIHYDLAQDAR